MYQVIPAGEQQRTPPAARLRSKGSHMAQGVSFFLVSSEPGQGPDLHRHPYSETGIVRSGRARITADGEDIEAGPGDIIVVTPETPHKFKNIGTDRLDIICIHASPQMIQIMLDE